MSIEAILITIVMFFLLVGVHEWGHLYFAKRAGILVREFAIGFGPKVISFTKNETQYTFRLIPFGGYVRMAGEDPEIVQINDGQTIAIHLTDNKASKIYLDRIEQRTDVIVGSVHRIDLEKDLRVTLDVDGDVQTYAIDPAALMIARDNETQIAPLDRQFGSKTVGQRAMTLFAGPMMNGVLALVLFFVFVMMSGVVTNLKVGSIVSDSVAEQVGLQPDDVILSVNNVDVGTDSRRLIETIQASPNKEMTWEIVRDGVHQQIKITPENIDDVGIVGIVIGAVTKTPNLLEAVKETWNRAVYAGEIIINAIRMLVTFQLTWDDVGGPVRMVEFTGEASKLGMDTLVHWTAILSLYLGVFNLLPFPALDGGRLLFIGLEAVRGKPVNPNRESLVHFIGFAMFMVLMIIVTYNDIIRLFKG